MLRSEVLYRLGHFRSSLADAENAIQCQPTAHKVSLCARFPLKFIQRTDDDCFLVFPSIIFCSHIYSMPKHWLQWDMLRMQLSHIAFVFTLTEIY